MKRTTHQLTIAAAVATFIGLGAPASAQTPPATAPSVANPDAGPRKKILQTPRWRPAIRDMDEWLSVQKLYSADEVARIRAEMAADVARMSPRELEEFLLDMEDRLDVLLSREAEDARLWVGQFLATARNAEQQLREKRPDVLNLSASEIRMELQRFQRRRASGQQSQAAFDSARAQRVQTAQGAQAASRQAQAQARDARARAADAAQANLQPPTSASQLPNFTDPSAVIDSRPIYGISPWGTPIRWNAFHGTTW